MGEVLFTAPQFDYQHRDFMLKYMRLCTFVVLLLLGVTGCSLLPQPAATAPDSDPVGEERAPLSAEQQSAEQNQESQPVEKSQEDRYTVIEGDSLSSIARRYSVSSLQIQYRNDIRNPRSLQIGTELVIPEPDLKVPSTFPPRGNRFIWPLKQTDFSSEFGERRGRHLGIDLRAPSGTPILAAADGVVEFVGKQSGYGKVVILLHKGDVKTLYAHNERNLVRKGQQITQGETIATVGRTGNASGNHIHFEYIKAERKLNPRHHVGLP